MGRSKIPDKLYFKIGEVADIAGVEPYVLRFWESEFPALAPKKSDSGHRVYRRKDVEMVLRIKELLWEKRYTIEGAKKRRDDPNVQYLAGELRTLLFTTQALWEAHVANAAEYEFTVKPTYYEEAAVLIEPEWYEVP